MRISFNGSFENEHPGTPGETLINIFMKNNGITKKQLIEKTGLSEEEYEGLVNGSLRITKEIDDKLSQQFPGIPGHWMDIQTALDYWEDTGTLIVCQENQWVENDTGIEVSPQPPMYRKV